MYEMRLPNLKQNSDVFTFSYYSSISVLISSYNFRFKRNLFYLEYEKLILFFVIHKKYNNFY